MQVPDGGGGELLVELNYLNGYCELQKRRTNKSTKIVEVQVVEQSFPEKKKKLGHFLLAFFLEDMSSLI